MTKDTPITTKIAEWAKIICQGYAIIGSDGQINPTQEEISNNHIYLCVRGNPFKIARIAEEYRKNRTSKTR